MQELVPGWLVEMDRGPNCLFIRLRTPQDQSVDASHLADKIWSLLEQHSTNRLFLELDEVPVLGSPMIGQLLNLRKRIQDRAGLMRICGLSDDNQQILDRTRLGGRFAHYRSREEAVMGFRPSQPK